MSALDYAVQQYRSKHQTEARAELSQLREQLRAVTAERDKLELARASIAVKSFDLQQERDELRATVAQQAAQLEQARSAIDHAIFFIASIDGYANGSAATGLRAWLAAHPAQVNNSAKSSNAQ